MAAATWAATPVVDATAVVAIADDVPAAVDPEADWDAATAIC